MKISKIIKKPRVLILLFFLIVSLIAINPQLDTKGISIKYIEKDSAAYLAGMQSPTQEISPTNYEKIFSEIREPFFLIIIHSSFIPMKVEGGIISAKKSFFGIFENW